MNLNSTVQFILTLFALGAIIGVVLVYARSRYNKELIEELKDSYDFHEKKIKELAEKVANLEKENEILKRIPLQEIMQSLEQVVKTQNEILARLPALAPTIINVAKK